MSTNQYRKKPVVIEAVQHNGDHAILEWLRSELGEGLDPEILNPSYEHTVPVRGWTIDPATGFLIIVTLEGFMQAKVGDFIIKGVQGEFYPCKPDIFEATYEAVEE